MKKFFSSLALFSLFITSSISNTAYAASSVKLTIKQSGSDMLLSWKYYKVKNIKNQIIKVINESEEYEKIYKPSSTSRSFRINDLALNKNYIVEISLPSRNLTSKKSFYLFDKPTSATNLSTKWEKDTLLLEWDYNGPAVKEWLITATGRDGKEYLSVSTNSPSNNFRLVGLSSKLGYTILLRGSNLAGIGKFTNAVASNSSPDKAENLKFQPISEDGKSVSLTWEYRGPTVSKWLIGIRASGFARDLETITISGKERNLEIRGLSESGLYRFILVGVNEYGNSGEVSGNYIASPPLKAPTNLKTTPLHQSIRLSWNAPFSDKGPISGYRVEYSPLVTNNWKSISTGSDTSVTVSNLKNGDQYKFRVSAITNNSIGLLSAEITSTAGLIPGVPTNIIAKPENLSIDLSWTPPKGNILSHIIEYKQSSDTIWTRLTVESGNTAKLLDLIGGKQYSVRIAAESESGLGQFTNAITITPVAKSNAPVLSYTIGIKAVNLSWSVPNDNGSAITGYKVFQRIGNGIKQQLGTSVLTINKLVVTNLNPGDTYHYEVVAVNAVGDSPLSNTISVNITAKPENLLLSAIGGNKTITLSWEEPNANGAPILAYKLERAGNGSNFTTISDSISANSYTDINLTNGVVYQYRLSARNSQGWSAPSQIVSATPVGSASAVSNLVVEPFIEELKVSWSPLASSSTYTGGSSVLGYKVYMKKANTSNWELAPGGVLGGLQNSEPTFQPSPSPSPSPTVPSSIATNLVISDLIPGQVYNFKVVVFTSFGDGAESEVRSNKPYGPPGAPIDLAAVGSDKKVTLSWGAPFSVLHVPASIVYKYKVEYSLDGVSFLPAKNDLTTLTTEITNLTNGYPYTFRVTTGYTVGGRTAYGESAIVSMTTRGTPSAPQNVKLTRLNSNSVRVDWSSPVSTGGAPILFYSVESSSSGNNWFNEGFPLANASSLVINNVPAGEPLLVRLKAYNTLICDATAEAGYNQARIVLNTVKQNMINRGGNTLNNDDFRVNLPSQNNNSNSIDLDLSATNVQDADGTPVIPGNPAATPPIPDIPAVPTRVFEYEPGKFRYLFKSTNGTNVFILDSVLAILEDRTKHCGSNNIIGQLGSVPAPSELTGLKVLQVGNGSVSLSWNANPSSENINNYRVEYSLDGSTYSVYGSPVVSNSVTLSNLVNNKLHYIRVSPVNDSGVGLGSTILATPFGPSPATNLSATAYDQKVLLSWVLPSNNQVTVSSVRVRYSNDNGSTFTLHGNLPANSTTTLVEGLTNSQLYLFEVVLITNLGESAPITATATPQPILPSQVTNLIATVNGLSVNLSWNPPSNTGIGQLTYRIEYKKDNSSSWIIAKNGELNTNFTISNLDASFTYNFRVTAVNASGSGLTTTVNAVT